MLLILHLKLLKDFEHSLSNLHFSTVESIFKAPRLQQVHLSKGKETAKC